MRPHAANDSVKEIVASTKARVGDEAGPVTWLSDGLFSEDPSRMSFCLV
jgi:hypothetical protein